MNKITLIGRLTRDPERKNGNNGDPFAVFSLAVNDWNRGEEVTTFYNVAVFGKRGESCLQYLNKGRQVYVDGKLQAKVYQKKTGEPGLDLSVTAQTVQFMAGEQTQQQPQRQNRGNWNQPQQPQQRQQQRQTQPNQGNWNQPQQQTQQPISNDPIPF